MVANVEITSKEMIKPSSPTPDHLRTHKLSFLDQIAPSVYIPLIFFYKNSDHFPKLDSLKISDLLKQSLSNVLTQFYPLAGRLSGGNLTVDCDDSGVLFVETIVDANLSDVINQPSMDVNKQFLALDQLTPTESNSVLLALQINIFNCGGIAIGMQMYHGVADGTSAVNFMNAWAASCRGDDITHEDFAPRFISMADLFPPINLPSSGTGGFLEVTKEKLVTKRFVFDKEILAKLKQSSASGSSQVGMNINRTRVEAVSALFWKRFVDTTIAENSNKSVIAAGHAVNLRPRMDPPLPDQAFGNVWILSTTQAIPIEKNGETDLDLVGYLSNALWRIDGDYVKAIQSGDAQCLNSLMEILALRSKGEIQLSLFTSWCRFPVYEVDYGWGKPVWVSTFTMPYENAALLMSTSCGEGIEAWFNVFEED
ncbi:OLC1v1008223C1 [Oldenlandia corymbosa var. corymbosa]|uniref:OLC1v1008223C1 n=1 Tax=Oldenlandia corymbosa var. corymbosa TaxID=529605 RepID=A0AAV1DNJ0_OLDCO|nr:OLC1v1008223C1 [Oldenlandia corymbosa var. corymbosa]